VFTVQKPRDYKALSDPSSRFSPADRIEYLKIEVEIPSENNLRFTHWNHFSTEYGEFEIADVSFARNLDLTVESPLGLKDAEGKGSFNRSEKQQIKSRYLKLSGSLNHHTITMEQEGNREIDLTGNVIAGLSLRFDGFPERITIPLYAGESDETLGRPTLETLRFVDLLVPRLEEVPDTLFAVLFMEYIYRHVESGWKTFAEWDDQVEYYTGNLQKTVPLLIKSDFVPKFFCIGTDQDNKEAVKVSMGTDAVFLLQFMDLKNAKSFLEWMENLTLEKIDSISIGDAQLLFQGKPLTTEKIKAERFRVEPVY